MGRPDAFEEGLANAINEDKLWYRLSHVARLFLLGVATFAKSAALLLVLKKRGLVKIATGPLGLSSENSSVAGGPETVDKRFVDVAQRYGDTEGTRIGERIKSLPVQADTGIMPPPPQDPTQDGRKWEFSLVIVR